MDQHLTLSGFKAFESYNNAPVFSYDMQGIVPRYNQVYEIQFESDVELGIYGFHFSAQPHQTIVNSLNIRTAAKFYICQVEGSGNIQMSAYPNVDIIAASRIKIMSPLYGIFTSNFNDWWYNTRQQNQVEYQDFFIACRDGDPDIDPILIDYMDYMNGCN